MTYEKHLMVFITISLVNDLSKSNWRNSILTCEFVNNLLQDIGTKWRLLLVPGMVFDSAKQSSRAAGTLTIFSWLAPYMWWKEFLWYIDQALIGSSKFGHVGVFVNYISKLMFNKSPNTIAWWLAMTSCKE